MQNLSDLKQLVNDLKICIEPTNRCDGCSRIYNGKPCSTLTKDVVDAMAACIEMLESCEASHPLMKR